MKKSHAIALTVPADLGYLRVIQQCAHAVGEKFGFDAESLGKIE